MLPFSEIPFVEVNNWNIIIGYNFYFNLDNVTNFDELGSSHKNTNYKEVGKSDQRALPVAYLIGTVCFGMFNLIVSFWVVDSAVNRCPILNIDINIFYRKRPIDVLKISVYRENPYLILNLICFKTKIKHAVHVNNRKVV